MKIEENKLVLSEGESITISGPRSISVSDVTDVTPEINNEDGYVTGFDEMLQTACDNFCLSMEMAHDHMDKNVFDAVKNLIALYVLKIKDDRAYPNAKKSYFVHLLETDFGKEFVEYANEKATENLSVDDRCKKGFAEIVKAVGEDFCFDDEEFNKSVANDLILGLKNFIGIAILKKKQDPAYEDAESSYFKHMANTGYGRSVIKASENTDEAKDEAKNNCPDAKNVKKPPTDVDLVKKTVDSFISEACSDMDVPYRHMTWNDEAFHIELPNYKLSHVPYRVGVKYEAFSGTKTIAISVTATRKLSGWYPTMSEARGTEAVRLTFNAEDGSIRSKTVSSHTVWNFFNDELTELFKDIDKDMVGKLYSVTVKAPNPNSFT